MKAVNLTRIENQIDHVFWYATTRTVRSMHNTANAMFYTGNEDMKQYFGVLFSFYEALRNYYNVLA